MKLHPRLSQATVALVTRFETFQPLAQPAAGGGWTVGYGHTRSALEGAQVDRADAEALLLYDLTAAAEAVDAALFAPVTQRQFEALTAFAFNIGPENFRRSSALARVNAGAELDAADEIERWRRAELGSGAQVVDALVRRRAAEKAHFLGLPEGFSKSPSAVLRPLASAGGEGIEAPAPEPSAPCATLTAANSVQARLRQLVPEPEAPPFPEARPDEEAVQPAPDPAVTPPLTPPPANDQASSPAGFARPPEVVEQHTLGIEEAPADPLIDPADAARANGAASEPELPGLEPFTGTYVDAQLEPVARPAYRPPAAPPPPPPPPPAAAFKATASEEAGSVGASRPAPTSSRGSKPRWSARGVFLLLTVLGAALFIAATVLILTGKPGFGNLGLGVLGALLMTPGIYGLLGPRLAD